MRNVLFTKLFEARPIDEIGQAANELGFDGIDLLIRSGFSVVPDDAATQIPQAVEKLKQHGQSVPMATTDLTDPQAFPAEQVLQACADAGIGLIRLGYWKYDGSTPYEQVREAARKQLDQLTTLAEKANVTLAIQLHGGTIHASGASTRALLEDRDPRRIAAYPDPGNQAVQSGREDWRLTLDLLGPWLVAVGVKNGGWFPAGIDETGQRRWQSDWLGLADGMVPWADILTHLAGREFDGLLTFHSHYELPYGQVLDQTRTDLGFVQRVLKAAR
jgi:sugar phosphate isomerase/epimerase